MNLLRRVLLLVILICGGFAANNAHAQLCSATSTGLAFGSFSPISTAATVSGTIAIKCTGLLAKARVCISIGPGVGQTSYSPRYMTSGTNTLQYNLYTDSAGTNIVGSTLAPAGFPAAAFDLPVTAGKIDTTVTVYGKLMSPQTGAVPGSYSASFGASAAIGLQTTVSTGTLLDCLAIPLLTGSFSFPVTASVVNDCSIYAANIDFGTQGLLKTTLSAAGGVTVTCTNTAAYTISLSGGATRNMTRTGGTEQIAYGLYTTSSYSTPWGDGTSGTTTVSGTGNGSAQTIPVYARVLPQVTPPPGSYSDTVIATVTF
ncbi:spore coat U domain-containing protein [Caballeronia sp. BR00000012568055]|uniref:Csu type fimbrial protein n=1 Tax=Caballeronia sp. BR00000012568055 TaxID=2918761 RepID=UPI0023F8100A|nr:spore coat U domain-containing protein [Caballeronia sp. BR00000012568055]